MTLWYHLTAHPVAASSLRSAPSGYVTVVWSLPGFLTPPFSTPQSCGCLLTVGWYSFSVWAAIRCCLKVDSSQTSWLTPQNGSGAHQVCTNVTSLRIQHRGVSPPPLHCWVNRSQLSEDWLLWSQASDILHLNAESITIKMARLVHAQTQHLWRPKGRPSRWRCLLSKPFIH